MKKRLRIFDYDLIYFGIAWIVFAFFGFVIENIFGLIRYGHLDARRQILPFLFSYGLAIFVLYVLVGTPKKMRFLSKRLFQEKNKKNQILSYVIYFITLFVGVFFGEMGFGLFVEKVAGVTLWNYTNIPLNVTKYTSVPTSLGFAIGILLLMNFAFEPLMRLIQKIPFKTAKIIVIILGTLIVIDFVIMIIRVFVFNQAYNYWKIQVFPRRY